MLEIFELLICLETIDQDTILNDSKPVIAEIDNAFFTLILSHERANLARPLAARYDFEIFGCDSTQAFLQPEIPLHMKGKILVRVPRDIEIEGYQAGELRELSKLIYGTKQSAKVWFDHITAIILDYKNLGVEEISVSSKDLCFFFMFMEERSRWYRW